MKVVRRIEDWRANRRAERRRRIAAASSSVPEGGQYRTPWNKTNPRRFATIGDEADGSCNSHLDYLTQVNEVYRMLEGSALYGGEPTKTVLGYRTSFLSGEGVRISADTPELKAWCESWLKREGLNGRMLTSAVADSEVVGHVLWTVDDMGRATCRPSFIGYEGYTPDFYLGSQTAAFQHMQPYWWPRFEGLRCTGIQMRTGTGTDYGPWLDETRDRYVYIRTGGHGNPARFPAPTTRLCLAVDSLKNYDRAVREARVVNTKTTRQVSAITHNDETDTTDLEQEQEYYRQNPIQDGDMVITRGQFDFKSGESTSVETRKTEGAMIVKHLSGVTAIPPHWLGYVDLMSNRATANSLFEAIAAGTRDERLAWEEGLYELIGHARRVLDGPAGDYRVEMPLLSFQQFAMRNEALMDLADRRIISDDNVRAQLPFDADPPTDTEPRQMMPRPMMAPPGAQEERA